MEEVRQARRTDLTTLSSEAIVERFEAWRWRTLEDFAESGLQPAVFASLALQELVAGADAAERQRRLEGLRDVLSAAPRQADQDQPAALHALVRGDTDVPTFLANFGHRGPEELELAEPRWAELPPDMGALISPRAGDGKPIDFAAEPMPVRRYCAAVALRETARHYFMYGYSYLRELLLELDRRCRLAGGIFFLRPDELPELCRGAKFAEKVRARRREYNLCRSLSVPSVLFSDDLEAIGRPSEPAAATEWSGHPISPGEAEGPAVVAADPTDWPGAVHAGFVLVCPTIDAAWLPLLARAAAVVLETGSDLSHGAILLREFGIPAVGVPGLAGSIVPGDRLRVDGRRGTISRLRPDGSVAS